LKRVAPKFTKFFRALLRSRSSTGTQSCITENLHQRGYSKQL
jgi:hypothetical protein